MLIPILGLLPLLVLLRLAVVFGLLLNRRGVVVT